MLEYFHNSSWLEHGGAPEKAVKNAFTYAIDKRLRALGPVSYTHLYRVERFTVMTDENSRTVSDDLDLGVHSLEPVSYTHLRRRTPMRFRAPCEAFR